MSIPTDCTNPDCTSRLHFIGGGYVYREWLFRDTDTGYYQDKDGNLIKVVEEEE